MSIRCVVAGLFVLFSSTWVSADEQKGNSPVAAIGDDNRDWSGFYAGISGGILGGSTDFERFMQGANATAVQGPGFNALRFDDFGSGAGGIFGVQVGYNYQMSPTGILGVEADFSATFQNLFKQKIGTGASFFDHKTYRDLDWFGTVRARAGYLATPDLLVYGTGGVAFGKTFFKEIAGYPVGGVTLTEAESDKISVGWTAGAGIEFAIDESWSLKAEYLYYDLGESTMFNPGFGPGFPVSYTYDTRFSGSIGRVGLNRKF